VGVWSSNVDTNAGLCGPLVSVGSVGTSYTLGYYNGIGGTNLGNCCPGTCSPPPSSPPSPPSPPPSSNMGVVAGGAAGGVLALLAAIAVFLYLRKRRAASQVPHLLPTHATFQHCLPPQVSGR